jgi:hypothetical protein
MMTSNRSQENRLRKLARKFGYTLRKSRQSPDSNNYGGYCLLDEKECIIVDARFDATLEEIDHLLLMRIPTAH